MTRVELHPLLPRHAFITIEYADCLHAETARKQQLDAPAFVCAVIAYSKFFSMPSGTSV